jgi:hypothetical protein
MTMNRQSTMDDGNGMVGGDGYHIEVFVSVASDKG